jgi:hypothetical protein
VQALRYLKQFNPQNTAQANFASVVYSPYNRAPKHGLVELTYLKLRKHGRISVA